MRIAQLLLFLCNVQCTVQCRGVLTIECKIQCSVQCVVQFIVKFAKNKRNIGSVPEKKWPTTFKSLYNLKHSVHLRYNIQQSVKKVFIQSRVKCSIQYLVVYCTVMCPATYVLEARGNCSSEMRPAQPTTFVVLQSLV